MIVYRYTTQKELESILQNNNEAIGSSYVRSKCNTHRYNRRKKYLHFFKQKESIEEIKPLKKFRDDIFYICEYDIPMIVLMLGRGVGYYRPHGYKQERSEHIEYIIPTDIFKSCWLKKYVLDTPRKESETTVD